MTTNSTPPNASTPLTCNNFFKYFITKPWSKHLDTKDKIIACLASGVLVLFVFIPHLIGRYVLYDKSLKKVTKKDPQQDPKADEIRDQHLKPPAKPPEKLPQGNSDLSQSPAQSPRENRNNKPPAKPPAMLPQVYQDSVPPPATTSTPKQNPPAVTKTFPKLTLESIPKTSPLWQPQYLLYPKERESKTLPVTCHATVFKRYCEDFLKSPVVTFLRAGRHDLGQEREASIAAINARLDAYEKAIQLRERLAAYPPNSYCPLSMEDLEVPWNLSGIPMIFMDEADFNLLTLEQIEKLPPRQYQMLRYRFGQPKNVCDQALNYSPQMTLSQFCSLSAEALNASLKAIPPCFFQFLDGYRVAGLSTKDLKQEQFDVLCPKDTNGWIGSLSKDRIVGCLKAGLIDISRLRNLKSTQFKELDLSLLNDDLFNEIFKESVDGNPEHSYLKWVDLEQIYKHVDRFSGTRLWPLSMDQIKGFDYSRIKKKHFDAIFPPRSKTENRISELNLQQVYAAWEFFDADRLKMISNKVLGEINFAKYLIDETEFLAFFPIYPLDTNSYNYSRVQHLKLPQIMALLPHFGKSQMFCIRPEQLKEFDFVNTNLTDDQLEGLFPIQATHAVENIAKSRMQILDLEIQVYPLVNLLKGEQLHLLSRQQLERFDFTHHFITKPQFDGLFIKYTFSGAAPIQTFRDASRVNDLKLEQVYALRTHFDADRFALFNSDKFAALDLTQFAGRIGELFSLKEPYKEITLERMRALDIKQIYKVWKEWSGEHFNRLARDKIQQLNFFRYSLTKTQFDEFFPAQHVEYSSSIAHLTANQLLELEDHMDVERLDAVTPEQVKELDLTQLPDLYLEGLFKTLPNDSAGRTNRLIQRVAAITNEQLKAFIAFSKPPEWFSERFRGKIASLN